MDSRLSELGLVINNSCGITVKLLLKWYSAGVTL